MTDKKKPERVPVDADYVMKIAKTVHETFRPQITFAKDPRGEEIAQAVAFVLLTEKRFQDMGLKIEERTAVIQAALRILADGNARAEAAARELAAPFVANAAEAAKPAEGVACEVVPLRKTKSPNELLLDGAEALGMLTPAQVREIGARGDYFDELKKENPQKRIEQADVDVFNGTALAKLVPKSCPKCFGRGWFDEIVAGTADDYIPDSREKYCDCPAGVKRREVETPEPEGPKSA